MPYKVLHGFDPWDIIIRDIETNREYALTNRYKSVCPVCFYPYKSLIRKECHKGIKKHIKNISYVTGHFYETDYLGNPNSWFGKLLKDISIQPYSFSHELLKIILQERITNANWNLKEIVFSTMVPTSNLQMQDIFLEISKFFGFEWIPAEKIFVRNFLHENYDNRQLYVDNKYSICQGAEKILSNMNKSKYILIFDDVFHQGFTLGRIIDLLLKINFKNFKLSTLARTVPKTLMQTFSFP